MNATRSHLSSWACALLLLVLLNGLACGIGHGQMMSAMFMPLPATQGEHAGMSMDMHMNMNMHAGSNAEMPMAGHGQPSGSDHSAPMPGMHSLFSDCFFAGSLPLALLLFTVLGWLLRHRSRRLPLPLQLCLPCPRFALPGLNPRAP